MFTTVLYVPPKVYATTEDLNAGAIAGVVEYIILGLAMTGAVNLPDVDEKHLKESITREYSSRIMPALALSSLTTQITANSNSKLPWLYKMSNDVYSLLNPGTKGTGTILNASKWGYDNLDITLIMNIRFNSTEYDMSIDTLKGYWYYNGTINNLSRTLTWYTTKATMNFNNKNYSVLSKAPYPPASTAIVDQNYKNVLAQIGVTIIPRDTYDRMQIASLDLPKVGDDYIFRIPALDQFKAYPKTATGLPDLSIGAPLVYDPALQKYKNPAGDVYAPGDVAWSFPKPSIKTDTVTGDKIVAYPKVKVDTATGAETITWENVKDTNIVPDPPVTPKPPTKPQTPKDRWDVFKWLKYLVDWFVWIILILLFFLTNAYDYLVYLNAETAGLRNFVVGVFSTLPPPVIAIFGLAIFLSILAAYLRRR